MVAYSFQKQFAEPILAGTKRQTIRAVGKRRHAIVGQPVQLYTGMRTKHCRLIGTAFCLGVKPVRLELDRYTVTIQRHAAPLTSPALDRFAIREGFTGWEALVLFWDKHHPGVLDFDGLLIEWGALHHAA